MSGNAIEKQALRKQRQPKKPLGQRGRDTPQPGGGGGVPPDLDRPCEDDPSPGASDRLPSRETPTPVGGGGTPPGLDRPCPDGALEGRAAGGTYRDTPVPGDGGGPPPGIDRGGPPGEASRRAMGTRGGKPAPAIKSLSRRGR